MNTRAAFLAADWRHLAMLNYAVDPAALLPLVPVGTELDSYNGVTYVSVVGFRFLRTRVLGIAFPFHRDFDEVNLRFYVRRKSGDEWRRGVVFVRELVPRPLIAWVARVVYHEPYLAVPMRHDVQEDSSGVRCRYEWKRAGRWESLAARSSNAPFLPDVDSEEAFITEHYWGYTGHRGATTEYEVAHPRWNVWRAEEAAFDADVKTLYGEAFVDPLNQRPRSAFIADGSTVTVRMKSRL